MKKSIKVLVVVLILNGVTKLISNPLVEFFINEVYFEEGDWIIELSNHWGQDYTGWYLKSSTDSAYFIDNLYLLQEYAILTKDSMKTDLFFNPLGDYISLHEPNGHLVEQIIFGGLEGSNVLGPGEGQSICPYFKGRYSHYLDQTPTLGYANDTTNANGTIEGYVCDSVGIPISGARIQYDYIDDYYFPYALYVNSDNTGYFKIDYLGVLANLEISSNSYETKYVEVQIWPDSIFTIDTIQLNGPITEIVEDNFKEYDFVLLNNYPNPFNPTTKIKFQIPAKVKGEMSNVKLVVYDILGNKITTLVNEQKPPGTYEVEFNGESVGRRITSGIYFYKLSVGKYSETKKMLLMK
jgi:type IX secretion system substrate protein